MFLSRGFGIWYWAKEGAICMSVSKEFWYLVFDIR
jgi:hypothetical protein